MGKKVKMSEHLMNLLQRHRSGTTDFNLVTFKISDNHISIGHSTKMNKGPQRTLACNGFHSNKPNYFIEMLAPISHFQEKALKSHSEKLKER